MHAHSKNKCALLDGAHTVLPNNIVICLACVPCLINTLLCIFLSRMAHHTDQQAVLI